MKSIAILALALAAPLAFRSPAPAPAAASTEAVAFKVDPTHSSTVFRVQHFFAPFWGRFNKIEGAIQWDEAAPEKSTVAITIDAGSVDTNDPKRDEHLKSPDFFAAKEFPTITFTSTKVVKKSDKELEVTGDLTLHGTKKSVTVPVTVIGEGETQMGYRAGFEATFEIKRSDFGVKGYIPAISDETRIVVALECTKG